MKVIGFVGPRSAGKDTCADFLIESKKLDGKIPFAGPLKKLCADSFKAPLHYFTDVSLKDKVFDIKPTLNMRLLQDIIYNAYQVLPFENIDSQDLPKLVKEKFSKFEGKTLNSPREILQFVGTDMIRTHIDDLWHCKAAFTKKYMDGNYAVTDIRFSNEYDYLKERFGNDFSCFYVLRGSAEAKLKKAEHRSELEIKTVRKKVPYIVDNGGTLEDLQTELKLRFESNLYDKVAEK